MTSLEDRQAIIRRGTNAKVLLESPAFEEAYDDLVNNFFIQFMATESHETDERETLWDLTAALRLLKGMLEKYRDDAKVEKENKQYDER